jgi:hypothetical protein
VKKKSEKCLNNKRKRNPSTNTRCSVEDEKILDYDKFLQELHPNNTEKVDFENSQKSKLNFFKLALNIRNKAKHEKPLQKSEPKTKKKIKKKFINKRSSNVYDIDNFVIQNNAICIHQRHQNLDIPVPVFKEISLLDEKLDDDEEQVKNKLK